MYKARDNSPVNQHSNGKWTLWRCISYWNRGYSSHLMLVFLSVTTYEVVQDFLQHKSAKGTNFYRDFSECLFRSLLPSVCFIKVDCTQKSGCFAMANIFSTQVDSSQTGFIWHGSVSPKKFSRWVFPRVWLTGLVELMSFFFRNPTFHW